MRGPKPEEETNRTIGQNGIRGNPKCPNGVEVNGVHSWFPEFLIVKKFSVQAGILGPSLRARKRRLPVYPHRIAKNHKG